MQMVLLDMVQLMIMMVMWMMVMRLIEAMRMGVWLIGVGWLIFWVRGYDHIVLLQSIIFHLIV